MQKNSDTNQIKFYVHGMHCESCQVFLKTKLSKHKDISKLETNLTDTSLLINKISEINDLEKFRNELNLLIKGSEYSVEFTPEAVTNNSNKYKETLVGFLVAGLFIFGFLSLQKAGLVNTLNSESVTLPFVFLVGLIASVSSCMAVVGGLILSLSTFMAKESPKYKKDVAAFHVSRVVSFFILGGVTGSIGKVFVITPQINLFINVFLFTVMVILGMNMLDLFKIKPITFNLHSKFLQGLLDKGPIILGVVTFFLPCGFTQAMEFTALSTGSALQGALIMFTFSLGTLPALLALSFASFSFSKMIYSGILFKTSGFIIIFFAIFNLLGALAANGIIRPLGI